MYILVLVAAIILIITGISEVILFSRWNKFYFSHGLKIFSQEIEISDLNKTATKIKSFITHLDNVRGFSKYTGSELDENTFAFRKKLVTISFFRNDFENIHGRILIDPETRTLKITGYAKSSFIAFFLYTAIFVSYNMDSFIAGILTSLFIILIFGSITYAFSRRKYKKLVERINDLLSE